MDVVYFLKQRTDFIRFYYDEAVKPFVERKRKIEDEEPPFDNPPYSEDPEPPYLDQWMEADTAVCMVGLMALSLLSDTTKIYMDTLRSRVIGFTFTDKNPFKKGFLAAYKSVLGEILATDWSDCPADWDIIEQVVLARNRMQHGEHLGSLLVDHDRATLRKHPSPFFIRDEEKGVYDAGEGLTFLVPDIVVTRVNLLVAIEQVESLADWIEGRMDRAW